MTLAASMRSGTRVGDVPAWPLHISWDRSRPPLPLRPRRVSFLQTPPGVRAPQLRPRHPGPHLGRSGPGGTRTRPNSGDGTGQTPRRLRTTPRGGCTSGLATCRTATSEPPLDARAGPELGSRRVQRGQRQASRLAVPATSPRARCLQEKTRPGCGWQRASAGSAAGCRIPQWRSNHVQR